MRWRLVTFGAVVGAAWGGAKHGAELLSAWADVAAEDWLDQGLLRLAARRLEPALHGVVAPILVGAVAGALVGGLWRRRGSGGRRSSEAEAEGARSSGRPPRGGAPSSAAEGPRSPARPRGREEPSSPAARWPGRFGRLALGLALAALAFLDVAARWYAAPPPRGDRPHVLWIVIDALRADRLGCYGHDRDTSPFIDALAAEGVRFELAVSQESYTMASVASYFTSTYPPTHGVLYDHPTIDTLGAGFATVAEILADAGYDTNAVVFNPHLNERFGLGQGFDRYHDNHARRDGSLPVYAYWETAVRMHRRVQQLLEERRASDGSAPLFLYLHYRDVHGPYVPPPKHATRFIPESWGDDIRHLAVERVSTLAVDEPYDDGPLWRRPFVFTQYDGEIRYTDDALVELFGLLEEHGIDRSELLVVVTSDHGEELREPHPDDVGGWNHGRTLYLEQIHVPLIFRLPGGAGGGRVVRDAVELVDVAPTLLELTGVERARSRFVGRSLVPHLRGDAVAPRPVVSGGNNGRGTILDDGLAYYRFETLTKWQQRPWAERPEDGGAVSHGEQVFDLAADRAQTRDVIGAHRGRVDEMRVLLGERLFGGRRTIAPTAPLDEDVRRELSELGYLGR